MSCDRHSCHVTAASFGEGPGKSSADGDSDCDSNGAEEQVLAHV